METESQYQLLPPLDAADYEELKRSVLEAGVLIPVEHDELGRVLDGHNRMRAVQELRAEGFDVPDPAVIVRVGLTEPQKRAHVRAVNLARRHLTAAQKRVIVEAHLAEAPERSDRAHARELHVSPTMIGMARRRLGERGTVHSGQLRVGLDGRARRLPESRTILAADGAQAKRAIAALEVVPPEAFPDRVMTATDAGTAARLLKREMAREARMERLRDPGELRRMGKGRYSVLLCDPPWEYQGASDPGRTAERHYPTLSHAELLALPVGEIAARDAVLFLWVTPPKVAEAIELVSAWNMTFKTSAVWDKGVPGLGSWYRQQHEILFVATRGKIPPPAPANRPSSVIRAPRAAHSAKPDLVRKQIEEMYPGLPRIELFARGHVPGWDVWGLEAQPAQAGDQTGDGRRAG